MACLLPKNLSKCILESQRLDIKITSSSQSYTPSSTFKKTQPQLQSHPDTKSGHQPEGLFLQSSTQSAGSGDQLERG
jgi:hypothetical protein